MLARGTEEEARTEDTEVFLRVGFGNVTGAGFAWLANAAEQSKCLTLLKPVT
jgi:hypothetical protein